jgi:hypothetical protein
MNTPFPKLPKFDFHQYVILTNFCQSVIKNAIKALFLRLGKGNHGEFAD